MQSWYVARTKPRREVAAAATLAQRDVEVYLPSVSPRRRASTRATPREPLFPGYVFARLDLSTESWLVARSAHGIAYFLGCDGFPSALPDELIETIRLRSGVDAQPRVIPFRQGESVVIRHGPFAGIEAVFDGCLSGRGRVRVLLEIVQRTVPVALDVDQLEKLGASPPMLLVAG